MIENLKQKIRELTPADWQTLLAFVVTEERQRRNAEPIIADTIGNLQDSGQLPAPEAADATTPRDAIPAWANPGTDHASMYRQGARVTADGKVFESIHPGLNHWSPTDTAIPAAVMESQIWRDVTAEYEQPDDEPEQPVEDAPVEDAEPEQPAAPDYKQPTGGHDAYKKGDQVTYQGAVWESLIDNNVWSPADYPQGWRKL